MQLISLWTQGAWRPCRRDTRSCTRLLVAEQSRFPQRAPPAYLLPWVSARPHAKSIVCVV